MKYYSQHTLYNLLIKFGVVGWLMCMTSLCYSQPLIYAHRGGRALWPENTLYAYDKALGLKVDFVDMDLQMSKDGVLMVTHNEGLNPSITRDHLNNWIGKPLPIDTLTVAEIQSYNVGRIRPNSLLAKRFSKQKGVAQAKIPTLTEVIQYVKAHQLKSTGFQIELKTPMKKVGNRDYADTIAQKLVAVIEQEDIAQRVEIQSFDFQILKSLHQLDSHLKLAFLTAKDHPCPKWCAGHSVKNALFLPDLVKELQGVLWEPGASEVTAEQIKRAHSLGLKVVVWGLSSDPSEERLQAKQLQKLSIDGLITDDPSLYL